MNFRSGCYLFGGQSGVAGAIFHHQKGKEGSLRISGTPPPSNGYGRHFGRLIYKRSFPLHFQPWILPFPPCVRMNRGMSVMFLILLFFLFLLLLGLFAAGLALAWPFIKLGASVLLALGASVWIASLSTYAVIPAAIILIVLSKIAWRNFVETF